jgi:DNA-directed RNA polymerase III subunit RPC3
MEMEMIREWEEKKVRLEVLERRVEECVFVIRDLGVGLDRGGGE